MIVPAYWAESRVRHRERERQVTVRRFGWSDVSQDDAQAMADARAREALQRVLAGETLPRREPRVGYNGAAGVPIREEIVERFGQAIVTRNSYGARCLNTPNVLFADVDTDAPFPEWLVTVIGVAAIGVGATLWWMGKSTVVSLIAVVAVFFVVAAIALAAHRAAIGGPERRVRAARRRIARFVASHPGWAVRVYRTPSGLRAMATHQTFTPDDPAVKAFFAAIRVDKVYAQMCANQQCFRARLSPKPWRIGMKSHMRPRPGVWPVAPDKRPMREAWIAEYEAKARGFAACRFVEAVGTGALQIDVETVRRVHDDACRALDERLPLA
jgi:hypothetical protein